MIAVIKYNAGNIRSVENALNRIGASCVVTDNIEEIQKADRVILPGVGEASTAMEYLKNKKLDVALISLKQPVLGICLGQQLMCEESEEGHNPGPRPNGLEAGRAKGSNTECMGIFKTRVKLFPAKNIVPQMGWNNILKMKGPLFKGLQENDNVYFIHSYYAELCDETTAVCDYISPFSAALQKGNFYATQFHPEKSGSTGEKILNNFLNL